ncbi:hypothetical protein LKK83_06640 [Phormidium sp. CCY1219]|nr:hypothetical protein [Phormidium sp. CCY1219]
MVAKEGQPRGMGRSPMPDACPFTASGNYNNALPSSRVAIAPSEDAT